MLSPRGASRTMDSTPSILNELIKKRIIWYVFDAFYNILGYVSRFVKRTSRNSLYQEMFQVKRTGVGGEKMDRIAVYGGIIFLILQKRWRSITMEKRNPWIKGKSRSSVTGKRHQRDCIVTSVYTYVFKYIVQSRKKIVFAKRNVSCYHGFV